MSEILNSISKSELILSAVIITAAVLLWLSVHLLYKKYLATSKAKGDATMFVRVSLGIVKLLILAGALLSVLQINGVNVTSAIAGLGLLSAIIGLAIQDVLKDAIMGMHILSDHFFTVGDVVKYKDIEGVVTGFNLKATTIRNIIDGTITTICNRNISEITKMPKSTMIDIDLPISYDEDFRRVNEILSEICKRIAKIDGIDRSVYKGTQQFSQSAVIYKLRFFCPPEHKPDRTRDALRVIQEGLSDAGIKIPFNQLDIHTD